MKRPITNEQMARFRASTDPLAQEMVQALDDLTEDRDRWFNAAWDNTDMRLPNEELVLTAMRHFSDHHFVVQDMKAEVTVTVQELMEAMADSMNYAVGLTQTVVTPY